MAWASSQGPACELLAVCVGAVQAYARGSRSGIDKRPVPGRVRATVSGLVGDAQGDLRVHGGPDKAIHHYPQEHSAHWQAVLGAHPLLHVPGAFGENLHTRGLTEADVCLGDHWRVGEALLEVSQARQPCWKLNERFARADMARQVQASRRTGWYYRVLQEGDLWAGAPMALQERPHPQWSMAHLLDALYAPEQDPERLRPMLALPLPASWLRLVQRRIDSGVVEDMAPRLDGPLPT